MKTLGSQDLYKKRYENSMSLTPILTAPPEIQIHAAAATFALVLGPVSLFRRRYDWIHKTLGYVWVSAMVVACASSFFISGFELIGPFSPLHLLAVLTLWALYDGVCHAIAGNIDAHRAAMQSIYWHGIFLAGLFTFLPGRAISRMLFPSWPDLGFVVIGVGLMIVVTRLVWQRRSRIVHLN
jgi:uncharacterized membrane protein